MGVGVWACAELTPMGVRHKASKRRQAEGISPEHRRWSERGLVKHVRVGLGVPYLLPYHFLKSVAYVICPSAFLCSDLSVSLFLSPTSTWESRHPKAAALA